MPPSTNTLLDRGLPSSPDAEKAILGAIILENDLFDEARIVLKPEHFYLDVHRRVYKAMNSLRHRGIAIDTLTLAEAASKAKVLDAIGGVAYLSSLTEGVPKRTSIEHYIRIVKDKADLRSLLHLCNGTIAYAIDETEPAEELIGDMLLNLAELVQSPGTTVTTGEAAKAVVARIAKIRMGEIPKDGLPTSLPDLDTLTGGPRKSHYIIVAARTSHGKSSFMRQGAIAQAKFFNATGSKKYPVIITLEMTKDALVQCMLANLTGIDFTDINDPESLTNAEIERLAEAACSMDDLRIVIDDAAGVELGQLIARCKHEIAKGAGVIWIDYLQLIRVPGAKNMYDAMTQASAALRDLSKATGVPILALCQLKRPEQGRENQEPVIYDLKECGNIENDAVQVWLIYRPQDKDELGRKFFTRLDKIIIAKNRFGPMGNVACEYEGSTMTFKPRSFTPEPPSLQQPQLPAVPMEAPQPHYLDQQDGLYDDHDGDES
jgi:replicative DNA helicase